MSRVLDTVPFVDLPAQHRAIAAEVAAGFATVIDEVAFVGGPDVAAFEQEYAAFAGAAHCVGVANGTDALELCLRGLGVGPGDEVIVPANTFIATAEAVARAGARPVFVDADVEHLLIDPVAVAEALTPRTRVVMVVDLYGQVPPVELLAEVLGPRDDVVVVEDAAQAHGASRHGRRAGTFGAAAGTSFYPGKNLGAYGDAGAVTTDAADLADRIRAMAGHGGLVKYDHPMLGFNSRLDTLQAVVLRAKLVRLAQWNEQRRAAAKRYEERLRAVPAVRLPGVCEGNEHAWHLYVVRVADRDRVLERLRERGVGAGIHYPSPLHLTGAFAGLGGRIGDCPVSERAAQEILSLPMFPGITEQQQDVVVDALVRAIG